MEKDLLNTIVAVEREVQERLLREEERKDAMLCGLRRALEEEYRREESRLQQEFERQLAERRCQLEEQAAATVAEANSAADCLRAIGEERMAEILSRRLARILRGGVP